MTGEDLGKAAAAVGAFAWLAYWTGRWYKEWYFAQFGIPYEVLGFEPPYYIFGSWATIATSVCALALILAPVVFVRARLLSYLIVSVVLLGAVVVLQVLRPLFSPDAPFLMRALGSRDISVMACGVLVISVFLVACLRREEALHAVRQLQRIVGATGVPGLIAGFLLTWAFLAAMGYAMGNYHGQAAIWDGKMGTRWVRHDGSWWVFVIRADTDMNFIFDRSHRRTKVVKDSDLTEWGAAVTRSPK
jgi:hypothetical protein